MKTILKWFGMYLYTIIIIMITLFLSSCGSMAQYNYTLDSLYTEYHKQK